MIKNVLGFILGLIVGGILFTLIQMINYLFVPLPAGFDPYDLSSMKELIDNMPVTAWLMLILSYIIGSFGAGFVCGKIAVSRSIIFPIALALMFMLGWTSNIVRIPHPMWVVVIVYILYFPLTYAGFKMAAGNGGDE